MVHFHLYQLKDKVICEARKKRGELQFQGKPIAIYEDYSPEVMEQRAQHCEVMAEMYKQCILYLKRPALLYLTRLSITTKEGSNKWLTSAEKGKQFLYSQRSSSE